MKSNKRNIGLLLIATMLCSCNDDFLDLEPQEGFTEENFFKSSNDLKTYVNEFYDNTVLLRRIGHNRTVPWDANSDDVVAGNPSGELNTRNNSGQAPLNIGWGDHYQFIRSVNFFLGNARRVPSDVQARQYIGEAFFARAFAYFKLLNDYGGVPLITEALDTDSEALYKPRESRDVIARQIIADLDSAILNLSWKGEGPAGVGRINKEAALLLKTRVGLYEGSWEHYHGVKGTPFAVSGSDGTEFLHAAVDAGEMLIAHQGSNIFQGTLVDLFNQKDYSNVPGAFFYKVYSQALSVTHNFYGNYQEGLGLGITKQLVDQFLMKDGKPASLSAVPNDETSLRALGQNKDPRLSSTIWTRPVDEFGNTIRFFDIYDAANNQSVAAQAYRTSYPGLVNAQQRRPSLTGYRPWKGVVFDPNEFRNGETDDLIFRYAEALLNYAEAKAILGPITQNDLNVSINVLRARAGMPDMILGDINSWPITYEKENGYDPGAPNILNEIRRERRVELALEGFRRDDLRRWAMLEDVVNGYKPLGAHAQEFIDYWNQHNTLMADEGFAWSSPAEVRLQEGNNYGLDDSGQYFLPFFNDADFGTTGAGGYVDAGRDYLSPIGVNEIELYRTKGGVELTQNPGWF